MSFTLAALALLATPILCPPQEGQIRWDGFHLKTGPQQQYELRGSIWDRDTNGRPSTGDLFRVDEILKDGRGTGAEANYFLIGAGIAPEFAKAFSAIEGELRAACESRVETGKDMTILKTPAALNKFILSLTGGGVQETSKQDLLQAALSIKAEELCKQGKHIAEKDLAVLLAKEAGTASGLNRNDIRGVAAEVAKKYAFACTRVEGKFTYP